MSDSRYYSRRALDSANWRTRPIVSETLENDTSSSSPQRKQYKPSAYPSQRRNTQQRNGRSPNFLGRNDGPTSGALAEGRRIYVGNLPYMAKIADVEKVFQDEGYVIEHIDMSIDPFTGRNPSYCFVEVSTREEADRAMEELTGKELLGRPLKVKPCTPKRQEKRNTAAFDRWNRADAANHWEGYAEQGRRLYVGGLPKPISQPDSEAMILDLLKSYNVEAVSKVISPHESTRTKPGNHYYAFVDLASAEDAEAAVKALNGTHAFGGRLRVAQANSHSRKIHERALWEETIVPSQDSTSQEGTHQ